MKIAVFYPTGIWGCAWSCQQGLVTTLQNLGADVLDCPVDLGEPATTRLPDFEVLECADLVMVSAIEYMFPHIERKYGYRWFSNIAPKAINLYTESLHRDDTHWNHEALGKFAKLQVFPAAQDAREARGYYLPFGVDTEIFYPEPTTQATIDVGFIGTLYSKRVGYMERIGYPISHVAAPVERVNGIYEVRQGTHNLRHCYNIMKIFVNLPALSRLLVTKITEVMACGTFLLTPMLDHPSALENMDIFNNESELVYYRADDPRTCGHLIQWYLDHPEARERIADWGCQVVHEKYSLRKRLQKILELV